MTVESIDVTQPTVSCPNLKSRYITDKNDKAKHKQKLMSCAKERTEEGGPYIDQAHSFTQVPKQL